MKLGRVELKDPGRTEWAIGVAWFALIWFLSFAGLVPLVHTPDQAFALALAVGVSRMVSACGAEYTKAGMLGVSYTSGACVLTWISAFSVLYILE